MSPRPDSSLTRGSEAAHGVCATELHVGGSRPCGVLLWTPRKWVIPVLGAGAGSPHGLLLSPAHPMALGTRDLQAHPRGELKPPSLRVQRRPPSQQLTSLLESVKASKKEKKEAVAHCPEGEGCLELPSRETRRC